MRHSLDFQRWGIVFFCIVLYRTLFQTLNELQIVPLRSEDVDDRVKNFKSLNADVCKVMPDILLATMNMLFAQYQKIKGNNEYIPRYQDGSMEMVIFPFFFLVTSNWIQLKRCRCCMKNYVNFYLFTATETLKGTSQMYNEFYWNVTI